MRACAMCGRGMPGAGGSPSLSLLRTRALPCWAKRVVTLITRPCSNPLVLGRLPAPRPPCRVAQAIRPKLSDEQRQQLQECFELMDQDGSGAIDADELGAAFKLLGERAPPWGKRRLPASGQPAPRSTPHTMVHTRRRPWFTQHTLDSHGGGSCAVPTAYRLHCPSVPPSTPPLARPRPRNPYTHLHNHCTHHPTPPRVPPRPCPCLHIT